MDPWRGAIKPRRAQIKPRSSPDQALIRPRSSPVVPFTLRPTLARVLLPGRGARAGVRRPEARRRGRWRGGELGCLAGGHHLDAQRRHRALAARGDERGLDAELMGSRLALGQKGSALLAATRLSSTVCLQESGCPSRAVAPPVVHRASGLLPLLCHGQEAYRSTVCPIIGCSSSCSLARRAAGRPLCAC